MCVKAWFPLMALLVMILGGGCTMDDEDRCPSGYFYVSELKVCCPSEDAAGNKILWDKDAKQCIADLPVDTDIPTDTEPCFGGDPTGFGVACLKSTECAGNEANFCAFNPMEGTGYCSITDCEPGCCQSGHECCDCTSSGILPKEKACLSNKDADLAVSAAKCTCED